MAAQQAWVYVDDRRTHIVRAAIVNGPPLEFVIKESAFGASREDEAYTVPHRMMDRWESKLLQMRLETRLTLLGNYYRSENGGPWSPVRAAGPTAGRLDLAPIALHEDGHVDFHHYGKPSEHRAVTLVGVPQETPEGTRYVLARLDFAFPDVEGGHLQLIHGRLPPAVYRSAVAALHLELLELGIEKAKPREGHVSADPRWWAALQAVLDAVLERLVEGRVGKGEPPGSPRRRDHAAVAQAMGALKDAKGAFGAGAKFDTEYELDPASQGVEGRKPEVLLDEVQATLLGVLNDPRLLRLHERMLPGGETPRLIGEGELAIKAAMKKKREAARPDEQHLVSILEASLLVRSALSRKGGKVDLEVVERLKHAPAWLS